MEIKYLSDGRKVVVVGQLNQTETIVQEVFVTEAGDELLVASALSPNHCMMCRLSRGIHAK
jgi:hypothetical protein